MRDTREYQVGDYVRLTRDLPMAGAGTEGVINTVVRDERQRVTALTIFIEGDLAHTYGTTVFPHEVEVVRRADSCDPSA